MAQAPPPPPQGPNPPPAPQFQGPGPGRGPGPNWDGFGPRSFGRGLGREFDRGFERGPLDSRLRQELGLTDEQMNKLRQMRNQSRRNSIRSRAEIQIKELELGEQLEAARPDRAAIDRLVREMADLRAQQMKAMIDMRLGLQDVLTADQRQKLRGLRERRFGGQGPAVRRRPEGGAQPAPAPRRPGRPAEPPRPQ